MEKGRPVYVCRVCHQVGIRPLTCHRGQSVRCNAGLPGDERSKPLFDEHGHMITRAPKWWVDACFQSQKADAAGRKAKPAPRDRRKAVHK